jgi:uncharacterized membrane-anchored protein
MDRRRLLIVLVPVGLIVLALVPAAVTFGFGWLRLPPIQPPGASPARDTTSLEAWTLLAVFYLVWMVALVVLLIWSYDRLDYHWQYHQRAPRPPKKQRRRLAAGMGFLAGQEEARAQAAKRSPRAPSPRPPAPGGKDGG